MKTIKELEAEWKKKEFAPSDDKQVKLYVNTLHLLRMENKIEALKDVLGLIDEMNIKWHGDMEVISKEELKARIIG